MLNEKPTYQELEQEIEFLRQKINQNENEEKFASYFENNKAIMLQIDTETKKITNANDAALIFYGFSKTEFLQKSVYDLQTLLPDEVDSRMKQAVNNKSNSFEFQHKLANNEIKDVLVYASPFKFAGKILMVTTIYDITEQKKAANALIVAKEKAEESEEKFKQLADNINEVFWLRTDNEMLYVNRAFEHIFGLPCQNLYANPQVFTEIIHADDKPIVLNIFKSETFIESGIFNYDYRIIRPDNEIRWINAKSYPIRDDEGKIIKRVGLATDITEKKLVELELIKAKEKAEESERNLLLKNEEYETINEELKQTNEELYLAKDRAEESDRLKSAFLQNMSHEVRTPLNAIIGFSELITQPNEDPEKLKKFVELINISSNKLIDIISDVIDISQIQAKLVKTSPKEIEIHSFIKEMDYCCAEKAKLKNIEFLVNHKIPDHEFYILSDVEKIKKIISHLTDNALKFTLHGSVEVTCELTNGILQITVSDTGIGISEAMQKVIFEPFRQVETGICRNFGGNGLGLSIVKAYTDLLNGTISLKSVINQGTTITVSIPVSYSKMPTNLSKVKKQNTSVKTVLVAEDEKSNYQYLEALLERFNVVILYAENGQQALDMCRSNSKIDVILMDIKMPFMDGYTAAGMIKAFRPNIPIIAQTAYALESEKEKYIGIFDDYITKPIKPKELNEKLRLFINI